MPDRRTPGPTLTEAVAAGPVLLDGGLATRLEARGHDLSDTLWSARLLIENPDEIRAVHEDFFSAGAQVATTASYQVSASGFARAGLAADAAETALRRSVTLARQATRGAAGRWVAASVGPYGATLADGSEYRGDDGLSVAELRAWHRPRLRALADAGPDVFAIETMPRAAEVEAVLAEIAGLGVPAWISMTTDRGHTRRGEPLADVFALAATVPEVIAVGANCCDPADIPRVARAAAATGLPLVFYPNSGETWDAGTRAWTGTPTLDADAAREWLGAGARLVGGCCRVGIDLIVELGTGIRNRY